MSIWFDKSITLDNIIDFGRDTMASCLGMKWVAIGDDFLKLSMPINEKTRHSYPYGFLHGGASCALAETVGSIASALVIDMDKDICATMEINANHIRSAEEGIITAHCTPLHLGKRTHVWDIKISDNAERLVCISRLTVAIISKR